MGWLSDVIGLDLVLETESVYLWRSLLKWRYGNENTFIQVSCVAFYGCFSQARSQAFRFSLRVLNPFVLKLLKLELKDSAYFPKRPLHHRWQGTNKASGIWVLLLTRRLQSVILPKSNVFEWFCLRPFGLKDFEIFWELVRNLRQIISEKSERDLGQVSSVRFF